jgi:hypothetical protein
MADLKVALQELKGVGIGTARHCALIANPTSASKWQWWLVAAVIGVIAAATIWFLQPLIRKLLLTVKVVSQNSNVGDETALLSPRARVAWKSGRVKAMGQAAQCSRPLTSRQQVCPTGRPTAGKSCFTRGRMRRGKSTL